MIINQGIDIVENKRIENIINKYGPKFINRIFSSLEIRKGNLLSNISSIRMIQKYSSRFAAKEAVSKALGTGFSDGLKFCEIEVLSDLKGKPFLSFTGFADKKLKKLAKKNKSIKVDISMSNEKNYSIAIATISEIS